MKVTERFSDRALAYERSRPSYPSALLDLLQRELGLGPGTTTLDVGAGTGILTRLLLERGGDVIAVEPNASMAESCQRALGREPRFSLVQGPAESIVGVADASADLATIAQAFHWLEPLGARRELRRVLRPPHRVAVIWNLRRNDTPFLAAYEALLLEMALDYREVSLRYADPQALQAFFGGAPGHARFAYRQTFDLEGLITRLLSSSYSPPPGHPRHEPMLARLSDIFEEHAQDDAVSFEYDTDVYFGSLA